MHVLPTPLAALGKFPQFIVWRLEPRQNERAAKIPVFHTTGMTADAHNPSHQTDFATASAAAARLGAGYEVGFVFTEHDPFFFLDLDECREGDGWNPLAKWACEAFPGAAVEISQSGKGLHIIGTATVGAHAIKSKSLPIDLFTHHRFIALTGTGVVGDAATDHTGALRYIIEQYYPPTEPAASQEWTTEALEGHGVPGDDKLLEKAMGVVATFGKSASFRALWEADADELSQYYPDPTNQARSYDESSADAALAQRLAFWTGNNCQRILDLMYQSELVRPKWEINAGYLTRTILGAIGRQKEWYTTPATAPEAAGVAESDIMGRPDVKLVNGIQILSIDQQIKLFADCVYVRDVHRILMPEGEMVRPDQFRATFGGYEFVMSTDNSGKNEKNAFTAFTESRGARFPKVMGTCFRPMMPPGAIVFEEGRSLVNTYRPIEVARTKGDPGRFLDHVARILPDQRDQSIILAYMAACIQHKGVKFQWTPLLQGVEGNGKTLLTRCVSRALGRRYSHYPKAADIDNKFNGWLLGKLFIGVEDIYVPNHRQEILETLKPMITGGDGLEIQAKGVDQVTADVCANFFLNSNHRDALRKTRNDRRFAVFYSAQQEYDHLRRDGIHGEYFPRLYDWLNAGGYAIVAEYLITYPIPAELNPAGDCHRAPDTSSTVEAIDASQGAIEHEIQDAIAAGRHGFRGGWVSSSALDSLLKDKGRRLAVNKRREMMQTIGYIWHPKLPNGRVNNPIQDHRPVLYVKSESIQAGIEGGGAIAEAFLKAQGGVEINKISVDSPVNSP